MNRQMQRYFIYLSYNGKDFCGWQTQPNAPSVQETIEKALSTVLRQPIPIVGAGRTDSGVHAAEMVAHFDTEAPHSYVTTELAERLNRILPRSIAIHRIVPVCPEAHARFDAVAREYKYYISFVKNPFTHELRWMHHHRLDVDKMNEVANVLFDYEDFTSFSKLHTDVKTNNCTIMHAGWHWQDADTLVFTIRANRFLRNMVRAIVGTLVEAGRGRLDRVGMQRIIEAKNRNVAGTSVPAQALFLTKVEYPSEVFDTEYNG